MKRQAMSQEKKLASRLYKELMQINKKAHKKLNEENWQKTRTTILQKRKHVYMFTASWSTRKCKS